MEKKYLIIDGNYFAQRVLGQLNTGNNVNNLETENEKKLFSNSLKTSLINLYQTFSNNRYNVIDEIIFCTDNGSWRKSVTPFKPYWFDLIYGDGEQPKIGYKEHRKAKKEESSINYDNFYSLYNEFVNYLKEINFKVISIEGCEGDDLISMISHKFKNTNNFGIVFCTDGDLEQVVTDNFILFRNIRSKEVQNGEFVITTPIFDDYENTSIFFGDNIKNKYLGDLFSICIGDTEGNSRIKRSLNEGIRVAKPNTIVFKKSFSGDAKDNIFNPISWLSSTGTRKYGISEKHLTSALKELSMLLYETDCKRVLNDDKLQFDIVNKLSIITKQNLSENQIHLAYQNVKHNLKMNSLNWDNIPEELRNKFSDEFDKLMNNAQDTQKIINNLVSGITQISNNIYEDSIDEIIDML